MFHSLNLQAVKPEEVGSDAPVFVINKLVLLGIIDNFAKGSTNSVITYVRGLMMMKGDNNFRLEVQTGNFIMPVFKIYITMKGS